MYFNFQVQHQILNWKLKSWYNRKVESEYPRVGQLMRKTCEVVKHIQFIAISTREKWVKGRKLSTTALRPLPCFMFSKEKRTNKNTTSPKNPPTQPSQNTLTFIFHKKRDKGLGFWDKTFPKTYFRNSLLKLEAKFIKWINLLLKEKGKRMKASNVA